jgi:hypothetical protein
MAPGAVGAAAGAAAAVRAGASVADGRIASALAGSPPNLSHKVPARLQESWLYKSSPTTVCSPALSAPAPAHKHTLTPPPRPPRASVGGGALESGSEFCADEGASPRGWGTSQNVSSEQVLRQQDQVDTLHFEMLADHSHRGLAVPSSWIEDASRGLQVADWSKDWPNNIHQHSLTEQTSAGMKRSGVERMGDRPSQVAHGTHLTVPSSEKLLSLMGPLPPQLNHASPEYSLAASTTGVTVSRAERESSTSPRCPPTNSSSTTTSSISAVTRTTITKGPQSQASLHRSSLGGRHSTDAQKVSPKSVLDASRTVFLGSQPRSHTSHPTPSPHFFKRYSILPIC